MWLGSVDLPQDLIEAHQQGNLVIFVGAGASMGPPSNLPSFVGLTKEIAADAGVDFDPTRDQPDAILGRADAHPLMDVHGRMASKINDPTSRPNALHRAIAALAAAGPVLRIVTTNYDRHLTTALADQHPREYDGPALPMGDDFEGLVYLHGTLTQEPRHLVATDQDFGRAYLRDAWAARFLERMFATYTVLFIGYSHNDLVMTYLARSLRDTSRRFALAADPPGDNWERLRITPIAYPNDDGTHAALTDVVQKWANRALMGLLDHRQQTAQLLSVPPSGIPEEMSYLEGILARQDTIGFFTEFARGEEWLAWAATRPQLQQLFDGSPDGRRLAYWFAEHYVTNEEHSTAALEVVRVAGGRLGPEVWSAIGHQLHMLHGSRPAWLERWLVLLVRDAPDNHDDWLDYALTASQQPEHLAGAILLFDHLTAPQGVFRRPLMPGQSSGFDIAIRGDHHWLQEAWQKVFRPHLVDVADEIIVVADGHLRRAHRMAAVSGAATADWDPLSYGRSAIEPHQQDDLRDPIDPLVDAARDCLEALLDTQRGSSYLSSWATSDVPLLRRLAVHGWTYRRDVSATDKISALRDGRWLLDQEVWHEAACLVASAIAAANTETADSLVSDIVDATEPQVSDYKRFTILGWIARHAPDLASAQEALARVRVIHPEYQEREHPEFRAWGEWGFVGERQPITPEELHQRIQTDAAAAIAFLVSFEDVDFSFDKTTLRDAVNTLAATVQQYPLDGFRVLEAPGADRTDMTEAVIRGWSAGDLDTETAGRVVQRLLILQLTPAAREVANLLANAFRSTEGATAWHDVPGARQLAARTWEALASNVLTEPAGDDWLTAAINHPAGWLAQFWLDAISADWQRAGDSWTQLPGELRSQLEELIAGHDDRAGMAQVILASRLHFLHGADHEWAESVVLPLLDWSDARRARRAWDGFLTWGRWNNRLLDVGLLNGYLSAARNIRLFRDDLGKQITAHLAAVATLADNDPITTGWARTLTLTVDAAARTAWLKQIGQLLSELDADAVEQQWTRWLRTYWADRLDSRPIALTNEEASAMAIWAVYLTDSIDDGIELARQHDAHIPPHSRFLNVLAKRIPQAPHQLSALLVHLLRGTKPPFHDAYQLEKLVRELKPYVDVTPVIEQAIRLGRHDAPNW